MFATASLPIHLNDRFRTPAGVETPAPRAAARQTAGLNVTRPDVPWRWRTTIADGIALIAVVWSFPFVILAIGAPLAFVIVAMLWLARWTLGAF